MAVTYTVVITHKDNGDVETMINDVLDIAENKPIIANSLRIVADMLDNDETIKKFKTH